MAIVPNQSKVLRKKMSRAEVPLLILAVVSVILYLGWLYQLWKDQERLYFVVAGVIDCIFVIDLLVKVWLRGKAYIRTPWFLIDLISTLPALLLLFPSSVIDPSFRAVRSFRFLQLIRTVRTLNFIENMKRDEDSSAKSSDEKKYLRSMYMAIFIFTTIFVAMLEIIYVGIDPASAEGAEALVIAQKFEYYLILGTIIGLTAIIWVVKHQIPAISRQQVSNLLNVALPHQVARQIMKNPEDYNRTVRMPATVIFCDIEGFTTAVEEIGDDLEKFKEHLEEAMTAIVEVHTRYDLIVDKFIGDCVMSFRGGDMVEGSPEEHAYRVVRAALNSLRVLRELDDPFFKDVRIGGASGENLLIGTFGTTQRLSYTVLGDRVNLAARLESACKKINASNLFCARTRDLVADREDIVWRRLGELNIRGKTEKIEIFEAFDATASEDLAWVTLFNQAIEAKEHHHLEEATRLFRQVDNEREGGDKPSRYYLGELQLSAK